MVVIATGFYVINAAKEYRRCIGASYKSQMQTDIDRTHSKLDAIRARLGWQAGVFMVTVTSLT